jgi:DNA-binding SARP family transcriptional activator
MFGSFSATYQGKSITGLKTSESQFSYLLQILIHAGDAGVRRDALEQALFGDKDLDNVHHAAQSVIYNSKKKLRAMGLPEANYIVQHKGVYYWTDEIPVEEDAHTFEQLVTEADGEEDPERQLSLYLDAIFLYTGGFLETQTGTFWAAQEERRYLALFCGAMEKAAELLRRKSDFIRLEDIGLHAARVHPLSDWETLTMEAMVAMGRYDDARKLYEDTVEKYLQEQGLRPSERMMELLNRLGTQMEHHYEVLDSIQQKLTETEREPGGYECSYPVFLGNYQIMERVMERSGQTLFLMLCTIVDSKGNPMKYGPVLDELSDRLGEAIQRATRRSDVICRYGRGQYLVLLSNTSLENCKVVQRRINQNFITRRQRTGVEYHVNSVFCGGEVFHRAPPVRRG